MRIADYKREIFGGLIGALLTAVLSLAGGLYQQNKSFELLQKKELLYGLKIDISLLRKVEQELDENLALLLNNSYIASFEVTEIHFIDYSDLPDEVKQKVKTTKDQNELTPVLELLETIYPKRFELTKIQSPHNKLIVDAWEQNGPNVSEIDFEVIQLLNDFYRKIRRVNNFIGILNNFSVGMMIFQENVNQLNSNIPLYNKTVSEISQNKILLLKNKISKEILRLQGIRKEIDL